MSVSEAWDRTRNAKRIARRLNQHGWIDSLIDKVIDRAGALESASDKVCVINRDRGNLVSDERLVETGARVFIAVKRVLGLSMFGTQIRAGLVMSLGAIAEMQTGEGKTVAGVLPVALHASRGKGVHVGTPNAYLAERDHRILHDVFAMLGLQSACLNDQVNDQQAHEAYRSDITFAAAHTFGFDYLRDALTRKTMHQKPLGHQFISQLRGQIGPPKRQRPLAAAIVDEADDVLIDDAVSPLILSGLVNREDAQTEAVDAIAIRNAKEVAAKLIPGKHFPPNLSLSSGASGCLTPEALEAVYGDFRPAPRMRRTWHEYVESALLASHGLKRDVHYLVRDGKIELIDGATGRIFGDRSWSRGLQQAVEAAEELSLTNEPSTLARITKQQYFRGYPFLAGMTGTAKGCENEFGRVYGTPVASIPTRIESKRIVHTSVCFDCQSSKHAAIVEEAIEFAKRVRAVLIGTHSVAESDKIAGFLKNRGVNFELLNGVQDADEAEVVAKAGQPGRITVATNLAGRGTDIALDLKTREAGGLHVIVGQVHSLHRVDRQLIGRSARSGDPGSARSFIAADDDLLVSNAPWISRAIERRCQQGSAETTAAIDRAIQQVQTERESVSARMRITNLSAELGLESSLASNHESERPTACWAL